MKVTLEFTLPEEQEECEKAQRAHDYYMVLWDLDTWLRGIVKHGILPEDLHNTYEIVRTKFWELLKDYDVSL